MTEIERKAVRDKALLDYLDAVDDRKAHCGRVTQLVGVLRRVVADHDANSINVQLKKSGPATFIDGTADGLTLPTHTEFVEAFIKCRDAEAQERRLYVEALNAGVPPDRLPPI